MFLSAKEPASCTGKKEKSTVNNTLTNTLYSESLYRITYSDRNSVLRYLHLKILRNLNITNYSTSL